MAAGLALILAGCVSPQQIRERASAASNYQLCEAMVTAPARVMPIIEAEIQTRSLDCRQYSELIRDRLQAESAQRAQSAAAYQMIQQMNTPRPTVNCTSYRMGNQVQTDCR